MNRYTLFSPHVCAALIASALSLWATHAEARPTGPALFCDTYPDVPACQGQTPPCTLCHTSTYPASWNTYGMDVLTSLRADFDSGLADALAAIELNDSDQDGLVNIEELSLGTSPGDDTSLLQETPLLNAPQNPSYNVDGYDLNFAHKRVSLTYCGVSPSYEDVKAFRALPSDEDRRNTLHNLLDSCLTSSYWRTFALPRLADKRIRPVFAVGWESPVNIQLADYNWDYRLFVYALTDGRDARDLLTAQYHVEENVDGTLTPVEGTVRRQNGQGGQPLEPVHRAGMISTQWFFVINTMFSALPRTSAAQAYRAYLGEDIAKNEGLQPVAGEPLDIDKKGVQEAECASCHSTLDPLSYAFSFYEGIQGPISGTYREDRPERRIDGWNNPQTVLFGTPVNSLPQWAQNAADSDAFKRNIAEMFFTHALQRPVEARDTEEFALLWQEFANDGYAADRLLHRLIDTNAFGAP